VQSLTVRLPLLLASIAGLPTSFGVVSGQNVSAVHHTAVGGGGESLLALRAG